jgi:DNA repair exonuclease SbcCD ATPase subunit
MNLQFDCLDIINFGSFAKQTFDLRSCPVGLNFLRGRNEYEPRLGSNGSGKSTIWAAMTWCLFGRTVDNLRNPDVQPWSGKGPTQVITKITKGKNHHEITRTIGPNKILIDGEPVGQEQIDKLLGINFEVFTHTILLGQGQPLFFDLRPSEKMRVFAEVLNLERWTSRSKAASGHADDIQRDLDVKSGELSGIDNTLKEVQSLIDDAKDKSERWEGERENRLKSDDKRLSMLKKESADYQRHLDKAALEHENAGTEAKALVTEIDKLKDQINADVTKRGGIELEIKSITREIDKLDRELDALGKADKCPTCGQDVKGTNMDKHKKEIRKGIVERQDQIKLLDKKLSNTDLRMKYTICLERLSENYDKFNVLVESAEAKINFRTKTINELKVKITTLQNGIDELSNNNNPYQEQVRTLRKRKGKLQADKKDLDEDLVSLIRKLERTKFWVKGFKDVQLYIIDEVLQELEMVSNSMLADIGLDDWDIKYAIEKETQSGSISRGLNVTIKSPSNTKPVKWESWSGGEGQRLRIVGSLALSDVLLNHAGINTNLEVLDEPSAHMSREGVRDLCPFLAERARQSNKQVFLVDHLAIPSSEFASVITVVKSPKRISMIVDE